MMREEKKNGVNNLPESGTRISHLVDGIMRNEFTTATYHAEAVRRKNKEGSYYIMTAARILQPRRQLFQVSNRVRIRQCRTVQQLLML